MDSITSPSIKAPSDKYENRALKAGLEEDDNEDIAYLNFRLLWPIGFTHVMTVILTLIGLKIMDSLPHLSFERFAEDELFYEFGKFRANCTNLMPYEEGMYSSILRQAQIKVWMNIFFQFALCVPMPVHAFMALVVRYNTKSDNFAMRNELFRVLNDVACVAQILEAASLSLIAAVNIRNDYPEAYRFVFESFIVFSILYMYIAIILSFVSKNMERYDYISVLIKIVSTVCFSLAVSRLYEIHQYFITTPECHGYVSPSDAFIEYTALISYIIFNLTQLIDIRHIRVICYPRTCSGECEPVNPENFKVGGKYEYCRAFELRQRQLKGLS